MAEYYIQLPSAFSQAFRQHADLNFQVRYVPLLQGVSDPQFLEIRKAELFQIDQEGMQPFLLRRLSGFHLEQPSFHTCGERGERLRGWPWDLQTTGTPTLGKVGIDRF